MERYSASGTAKGSAPFFADPAAETTTRVISAVNGVFLVNGEVQGVITSAELKVDLSPGGDPVAFNKNLLPEIFLGKAVVTGTVTAMLQDDTLIGNFADEDELSLILFLVTDDMLGLFDWTPKFVRRYADLRGEISKAVAGYADDVRARRFPGPAEIYFAKAG